MNQNSSNPNSIVRVWAYTRVNTDEAQRGNNSLGTQQSSCEQFVQLNEMKGWKLMRVVEDAGHSAATLKRPGMQELIEATEAGQLDVAIIHRLDRLTRNLKDFYQLCETMDRCGVNFVSVSEKVMNLTGQFRTSAHRQLLELVKTGGLVRRGAR